MKNDDVPYFCESLPEGKLWIAPSGNFMDVV